ncbi:MAG: DUF5329 domain-containing protein [Burkholderiales bacterium]|nr:DUF5329 domain-containing protein [Burkholderiales bacterium]
MSLFGAVTCSGAAQAAPAASVRTEVDALMTYVQSSGCRFYRNGTWYGASDARSHLRDKYEFLALRGLVDTTEAFIDRAATRSSLSGQPYQVKCGDSAAVPSGPWLHLRLARLRSP